MTDIETDDKTMLFVFSSYKFPPAGDCQQQLPQI